MTRELEPRIGRPRVPEDRRRGQRLWCNVTPAEFDAVCRAAVRAGVSVSDLLREQVVSRYTKPSAA